MDRINQTASWENLPFAYAKTKAVCPGKLSWDLGLKSNPKAIEPTTPGLQGE